MAETFLTLFETVLRKLIPAEIDQNFKALRATADSAFNGLAAKAPLASPMFTGNVLNSSGYLQTSGTGGGISSNTNGELRLGNNTQYQGRVSFDGATGNTLMYFDSTYDNLGAAMVFRLRTNNASPVTALKLLGDGSVLIGATSSNAKGKLQVNDYIYTKYGLNMDTGAIITTNDVASKFIGFNYQAGGVNYGNLNIYDGKTGIVARFEGITGGFMVGASSLKLLEAVTPKMQVVSSDPNAALGVVRYSGNGGPSRLILASSRGTESTRSAALLGDISGSIIFAQDDGTGIISTSAIIQAIVDAAPTGTVIPGRLSVFVKDQSGNNIERLRLMSGGTVTLGGAGSAYAASFGVEAKDSIRVYDSSSSAYGLKMGFTSNVPYIQGYRETVGAVNLQLNPSGGSVLIGGLLRFNAYGVSTLPAAAYDVMFEAVSNTQIKIKMMGNDAVIRSTTLALA